MTEVNKDIQTMITGLYNKFITIPRPQKSPRKICMREYFIYCYIKEGIYKDLTPFNLTRGNINDISYLAAQMTWKFLTDEEKQNIKTQYEAMTDDQLEHLENH